MLLSELLPGAPAVEVSDLAYDHRRVEPGAAFFCVRGFTRDGHDLAGQAIERGAAALVVDHPLELGAPEAVVPDVRAAMAPAAAAFNGDPTAQLAVAGVTGTNGKTTTTFLLRALLEAAGKPTGMLGTVTAVVGGVESEVRHTTPEAIDLQRTFAEMRNAGDTHVAMEVSSHALSLHRVDAIRWDVAIFTNLTQDHLDFHSGGMEDYFDAKRRLFDAATTVGATCVINVDDPYGRRLAKECPGAVTVGIAGGDVRATDLRPDSTGTTFAVGAIECRAPLPGGFNVLNSLCAIAAARALGVGDSLISEALGRAAVAPGRFQPVEEGQEFTVLVDYAHTPDSLDRAMAAASELARNRLIAVFGAGGDRDRSKRPLMGEAVARHADIAIVTSDNPRNEDPEEIIAAIIAGMSPGAGPQIQPLVDRRTAIEAAIGQATEGDVVVIAGKGHEQGQEFAGGEKLPFDDVAVVREVLRARLAA